MCAIGFTLGTGAIRNPFKIAPLHKNLNKRFKFGFFTKQLSIDEQTMMYYHRHSLKQFIKGKPITFGYQNWAISVPKTDYYFNVNCYEEKKERQD